jgi:hypothetical protein
MNWHMPLFISLGLISVLSYSLDQKAQLLDTRGGIKDKDGDSCTVYWEYQEGALVSEYIVCDDGTRFDNPVSIVGSPTGTPPHLMYDNYIGSYIQTAGILPRLMGAGRRKIYFDGTPRLKEVGRNEK